MTTTKKRVKGLAWGLLVLGLSWGPARAGNHEGNPTGSDMIRVRITPNASYGVSIDTTNVQGLSSGVIDLGALDLGSSTQTVKPATVTMLGNIAYVSGNAGQELNVNAAIPVGGWTFDPSPTTSGAGSTVDKLAMYLLFSGTGLSVAPSGADFANGTAAASITSDAVTYHAGSASGTGSKFVDQNEPTPVVMDNMSATDKRHMWLWFRLPNNTSTGAAQEVTVTLTALGGT